jgi:uncharacterized protein YkwD
VLPDALRWNDDFLMIRRSVAFHFFALVTLLSLAGWCQAVAQSQDERVTTSETSGPDFRSQVEKETYFLINDYRKTHGLPLLTWSDEIAKAARAHSKDMATGDVDFGHEGFKDRVGHLKTMMPGFRGAGENVLMSSELEGVAKSAVALWLRSPHHLENIRGDFNYSGLGVWQDKDGVIYFTQIFMKFVAPPAQATDNTPPAVNAPFGLLASPETRESR